MKLCCPQRHASSTRECHWASSQYPSCWQQSVCLPLRRKTGDFLSTSLSFPNPQQITFLQYIPLLCILSLSHHLSSKLLQKPPNSPHVFTLYPANPFCRVTSIILWKFHSDLATPPLRTLHHFPVNTRTEPQFLMPSTKSWRPHLTPAPCSILIKAGRTSSLTHPQQLHNCHAAPCTPLLLTLEPWMPSQHPRGLRHPASSSDSADQHTLLLERAEGTQDRARPGR